MDDDRIDAAEPHRIAAVLIGDVGNDGWRDRSRAADFYDAKGLVELLGSALGVPAGFRPAGREFLHPARAAEVVVDDAAVGWAGELHPAVLGALDARTGAAFEIDLEPLLKRAVSGEEVYEDVTTYPAVAEDIAVVADRDLSAERVRSTVLGAGGRLLGGAEVFDVYEGEQVPDGKRSLALRLEFRAPDRTLTDAEVATVRAEIVTALEGIGADLRG